MKNSIRRVTFGIIVALVGLSLATSMGRDAITQIVAEVIPAAHAQSTPTLTIHEPMGSEYSHGLSLWQMNHSFDWIEKFHTALGSSLDSFMPSAEKAPGKIGHMIIDPENLTPDILGSWTVVTGSHITTTGGDNADALYIPIAIPKKGSYKVSFHYRGYTNKVALYAARLFPKGQETQGDFLDEIFNDEPVGSDGYTWHSMLVDLDAGEYVIRLQPRVTHNYYTPVSTGTRDLEAIHITDAIWAMPPTDTELAELRINGSIDTTKPWQIMASVPMNPEDTASWQKYQVRPLTYEMRKKDTALYNQTVRFRKEIIRRIAARGYCGTGTNNLDCNGNGIVELQCDNLTGPWPSSSCDLPHYKDDSRLIYFDEDWNMMGDPVRVALQKEYLKNHINPDSTDASYCFGPTDFSFSYPWEINSSGFLRAEYSAQSGEVPATYTLSNVREGETYKAWLNFRNLSGYYATKHVDINCGGTVVATKAYSSDLYVDNEGNSPLSFWDEIGIFTVPVGVSSCSYEIYTDDVITPHTYRMIYNGLVTTDTAFVPDDAGGICPELSPGTLVNQMVNAGADASLGYAAQIFSAHEAVTQSWMPSTSNPIRGTRLASGFRHDPYTVSLARNMDHHVIVALRNMTDEPIVMRPKVSSSAYGQYWKVVGFMPFESNTLSSMNESFSAGPLFNRSAITIPPYNVAQVLVGFSTDGLSTGTHSFDLLVTAPGYDNQVFPIVMNVTSTNLSATPAPLMGGYLATTGRRAFSGPGYDEALKEIGVNMLTVEPFEALSAAEMLNRGIVLQVVNVPNSFPDADYADLISYMTDGNSGGGASDCLPDTCLGLSYDDWVMKVGDEPSGSASLASSDAALIKGIDPSVRILFNPGEAATLATFTTLEPWADMWQPFVGHVKGSLGDQAAKYAIYSQDPWMFYDTPVYKDKEQYMPNVMRTHIAQSYDFSVGSGLPDAHNFQGTDAFAFYYVFRNPWDTAHEYIADEGTFLFPGVGSAVETVTSEVMQEAYQHARLVEELKKEPSFSYSDPLYLNLMTSGDTNALVEFLGT